MRPVYSAFLPAPIGYYLVTPSKLPEDNIAAKRLPVVGFALDEDGEAHPISCEGVARAKPGGEIYLKIPSGEVHAFGCTWESEEDWLDYIWSRDFASSQKRNPAPLWPDLT